MSRVSIGFDIGSISLNTVVMTSTGQVLEDHYTLCRGRPFHTLHRTLSDLMERWPLESVEQVAVTGTGGELAGKLIGASFVNEIVAQAASVAKYYPEARTVIEIGGEDSKLICIRSGEVQNASRLGDFSMNTVCAAGTGSFLDQQARRMGISIEGEFGELAMQSADPPHIAGRCSVFAKSDMIHLQQIATPVEDIVAGLCFAVARNLRSNLARGQDLEVPVVFQGGVAANAGVVRGVSEVFGLSDRDLIVPRYHASMGAIGALLTARDHGGAGPEFVGVGGLEAYLRNSNGHLSHWAPLVRSAAQGSREIRFLPLNTKTHEVYLGVDVGSLSTNVVLIDEDTNVVARRYLPTAGKPLEAIRRGLAEINDEVGDRIRVCAAGTTGSGRYLTGHFIGADTIKNEITAQATAAIHFHPEVDTIFEIGGQDSKFISIDNGVVVDFEMNKVCAAGTGSFLEEQAEKLGVSIVDEFGALALSSQRPSRLGDRCTVFMESDLNSHQQRGAARNDLIGGLAYSIVQNYIQKVVGAKRIGDHILFQGGVTNNPAVVAAFEHITGKEITVPPHFDVTGAIGAAMLARDEVAESGRTTAFKGFQVSSVPYSVNRFNCTGCENHCDVHKVVVEGERRALHYGDRCDRYQPQGVRKEKQRRRAEIPNLFEKREEMLWGDYRESDPDPDRITIGIPRSLMVYYQRFPYWRTFFEHLGFQVVLSRPSDRPLVKKSLSMLVAETCFPVEVMHGHIQDLLDRGVQHIFTPFEVDYEASDGNPTINYNCPWIQCYPFMIRSALKDRVEEDRFLVPALHFRYSRKKLEGDLAEFMNERFGTPAAEVVQAMFAADEAQRRFENDLAAAGDDVLRNLPTGQTAAVILGRPYNAGDPELNLGLVQKLIDLNVLPVPLDMLPLDVTMESVYRDYEMVCWPNGQKIIAGARIVAADERLNAVYISNFRCGPDSFLSHYVREEMKGKPYLQLEVDEHSADAGMITRCEAFLESLKAGNRLADSATTTGAPVSLFTATPSHGRKLYFPYMCDAAHLLAAASRACGIDAQVLPMQDETDLEWGRKHTSSRECFPMICTVGSILRKLHEPGVDPSRTSFFMPSHGGPCRFGQYQKLQRVILANLGFSEVEIVSPSNKNSYADFVTGSGVKFRLLVWKGLVASEILARLRQERAPYEAVPGEVNAAYERHLARLSESVERGAGDIRQVLRDAADEMTAIRTRDMRRKPVVAIIGEIFMRDNAFCSGFLRDKLERLGAETVMASVREWLELSSFNYRKVSKWQGELLNTVKARIQLYVQSKITDNLELEFRDVVDMDHSVSVDDIVELCRPYIHPDYSGEPPMAFGAASKLAGTGISGVAAVIPFTCLPGTVVASLANQFRADNDDIPWVTIAFDGQEDTGIETRLQAFVHQATEFAHVRGYDRPVRFERTPVAAGGIQ